MPNDVLSRAMHHHDAGRLGQARLLYEEVLGITPNHPDALHLLGVLSFQSGEPDTAVRLIRQAISHQDGHADYFANLGMALSALGQVSAAMDSYRRALQLDPTHANAHYNIGSLQRSQGQLSDAIASLSRSVVLDPLGLEVRTNLAALHLENKDPTRALTQCEACLKLRPDDRMAIGYKAIALQALQHYEQARYLLGLERFVSEQVIQAPSGFDTIESFNLTLADGIRSHPSLVHEHPGKATRNGLQTGDLLAPPKGPFAAFEMTVNDAVNVYLKSLPNDSAHPFLRPSLRRWRLDVWGVILNCAGYQTAHMHPGGWVSGVYYVDLPKAMDKREPEGCIEFGRPPEEFGSPRNLALRQIRPEEGKLILFPSYLFHQTIPFTSSHSRISIAFDVIPLEFG